MAKYITIQGGKTIIVADSIIYCGIVDNSVYSTVELSIQKDIYDKQNEIEKLSKKRLFHKINQEKIDKCNEEISALNKRLQIHNRMKLAGRIEIQTYNGGHYREYYDNEQLATERVEEIRKAIDGE